MKYCDKCHSTYPTEFTVCPKDQTALRETSELPDGSVLRGKYQVICKIGAGGMATVYKANHLTFNEVRALKVVSSSLLNDKEFIARFKNEAVITRKLKHPNAVRVDDFDLTDDGRPYIVMEYVEGKSLRDVMHHDGPFTPARALAITRQVAAALAAAHKLGIVHRDIKPDNILIETQAGGAEFVKVLDFGIAKLREGAGGSGSGGYTPTQTGMVMGTPQYISPEQAMGQSGDQIDGRADLYSLGIVLYEMLTGEVPFKAETPVALLIHHINTVPTPAHTLKPELKIPQPLSQLLMKALEKDRDNRFQSADEMLAALDRPQKWAELAAPSSARKGKAAFSTGHEDDYATVPRDRDEGGGFPTDSTRGGLFDEDRARKSYYEDWLKEEEKQETKLEPKPVAPVPVSPGPTPATAVATPPGMVPVGAAGAAAKPAKTITPVSTSGPPSVKIGIKQVAPVPVSVPAPPPRRVVTPVPEKQDYRNYFIAGGGALVLLLIIGGYFLFRPHPQPPAAPTTAAAPTTPGVPAPGTEDARIYDGVKEMLAQATSDSLRAQPPLVAVDKGVVTLSGRVASREDQMLAYQLAGTVDGVTQVNNEMKIGAPVAGGNRATYPSGTQTTLTPRNNTNTTPQNPNVILSPEEAGSVSLGDAARQRARQLPSTQQQIEQHLRQGHAAMQSEDYDGAIAHFQQVLQLDPTNPAATLGLRRAERLKNTGRRGR